MALNGIGGYSSFNGMNIYRLQLNQQLFGSNLEKIGSGLRINRGADDAAGLTISEGMRSQIRGLGAASNNVQSGISMIRTAEGGLSGIQDTLNRVRELTIQAGNGAYTEAEIGALENEAKQLLAGIDDTSRRTEFNTKKLLDGSGAGRVSSATPGVKGYVRGNLSDYGSFEGSVRSTQDADGNIVRELQLRGRNGQSYSAVLGDDFRANNILPNLDIQMDAITSAKAEGATINSEDGYSFSEDVQATFTDQGGNSFNLNLASGTSISQDDFLQTLNDGFTANNVDMTASFDGDGNLRLRGDNAGESFTVSAASSGFSQAFGINNQTVLAASGVSSASTDGYTSSQVKDQVVSFNSAVTFDVSDGTSTASVSLGGAGQTLSLSQIESGIQNQVQAAGVRVDAAITDGKLSFESVDAGNSSRVSVTDTSGGASNTANTLGFNNQSTSGSGSTNFVVNVTKTGLSFQNGANQGQSANFALGDFGTDALGLRNVDFSSQASRDSFLGAVDRASRDVSSARSSMGAQENAFEAQYSNLRVAGVNTSRTESMIRDMDMAQAAVDQSMLDMQRKSLLFAQVQGMGLNTALLQRLLG
jgi:flagellin